MPMPVSLTVGRALGVGGGALGLTSDRSDRSDRSDVAPPPPPTPHPQRPTVTVTRPQEDRILAIERPGENHPDLIIRLQQPAEELRVVHVERHAAPTGAPTVTEPGPSPALLDDGSLCKDVLVVLVGLLYILLASEDGLFWHRLEGCSDVGGDAGVLRGVRLAI